MAVEIEDSLDEMWRLAASNFEPPQGEGLELLDLETGERLPFTKGVFPGEYFPEPPPEGEDSGTAEDI